MQSESILAITQMFKDLLEFIGRSRTSSEDEKAIRVFTIAVQAIVNKDKGRD